MDCAQNIVVFKTLAGLAGGACEALDHMDVNGMVGTLAGENTVFVVMKDNASAETSARRSRKCCKPPARTIPKTRNMLELLHIEKISR